jgi:hypothetical protein
MPFLALLRRGVRRKTGGSIRKKRPITPAMLLRWARFVDQHSPAQVSVFASMLTAFFGLFRKSSVAAATQSLSSLSNTLRREDITLDRYCLIIQVPRSKTNQFGERRDLVCIAGAPGSPIDPVWWYQRTLQLCPAGPGDAAF